MVIFLKKEMLSVSAALCMLQTNPAVSGGSVATFVSSVSNDISYFLKTDPIVLALPRYLEVSEMKLLLNVVQLLLLCLNVGLQDARPLLQLLLQLIHYAELRLLQLIHG